MASVLQIRDVVNKKWVPIIAIKGEKGDPGTGGLYTITLTTESGNLPQEDFDKIITNPANVAIISSLKNLLYSSNRLDTQNKEYVFTNINTSTDIRSELHINTVDRDYYTVEVEPSKPVDEVKEGDMHSVTSNGVFKYMHGILDSILQRLKKI